MSQAPINAVYQSHASTITDPRSTVIPTEAAPATRQELSPHRGRAEGPLSLLLDDASEAYLVSLLDRISECDDLLFVYILASSSGTFYIGMTNNISRRIFEHRQKINKGFSAKYGCRKLVYLEIHHTADEAIDREKQIKRWNRAKKERLVRTLNPVWMDFSSFLPPPPTPEA